MYRISTPKWKSGVLGKVYEVQLDNDLKGTEANDFASGEMMISGNVSLLPFSTVSSLLCLLKYFFDLSPD